MIVRPASLGDVDRIAELLKSSFEPRLHPFLIHTQHGAGRFISSQLTHAALYPGRTHVVVEHRGDVIGYADLREPNPASGFLSYICVDANHRGRGVARTLLAGWLHERGELKTVQLDVFDHNQPALRLYERLGFTAQSLQTWARRSMPTGSGQLAVQSFHTTLASIDTYGFGELQLIGEGVERIGLMGTAILKCPDFGTLRNESLLARLSAAMPLRRQAFAVLDEKDAALLANSDLPHDVLLRSRRMSVEASELSRQLERGGDR